MRGIGNPMGVLIRQVPRYFEGESFRQYRQLERQRKEAALAHEAELRQQWQRILEDPNSTDEEKDWARQLLAMEDQSKDNV